MYQTIRVINYKIWLHIEIRLQLTENNHWDEFVMFYVKDNTRDDGMERGNDVEKIRKRQFSLTVF